MRQATEQAKATLLYPPPAEGYRPDGIRKKRGLMKLAAMIRDRWPAIELILTFSGHSILIPDPSQRARSCSPSLIARSI